MPKNELLRSAGNADPRPRVYMRERAGEIEWRMHPNDAWANAGGSIYNALCCAVGEDGADEPAMILWEGGSE